MSSHSPIILAHLYVLVWSGQIDIKLLPAEYPYRETWAQFLGHLSLLPGYEYWALQFHWEYTTTVIEGRMMPAFLNFFNRKCIV